MLQGFRHARFGPQDCARRYAVDSDMRCEVLCERTRQHCQARLGGTVNSVMPEGAHRMYVHDVDDRTIRFTQVAGSGLCKEQRCLEVAADKIVPLLLGNVADWRGVKTGGVIHQSIQSSAPFDDIADERWQSRCFEKIGLKYGRRVGTQAVQLRGEISRIIGRATVVNGDACAVLMQACHNSGANATGRAGDQDDLVVKCLLWHAPIHKDFIAYMQYTQPATLPQPDDISATHSARVAAYLRERIETAGGSISFAEFMHEALYAPGLGYYSAGTTKFGGAGDFITAPEVSSIFGRVLARQCAEVLGSVKNGAVLEAGAGSGKLALDMLTAFESMGALPSSYNILEVSADLADRQQRHLQDKLPHLAGRIHWLSELPENFDGIIIANEVVDALPVERFIKRNSEVLQLRVAVGDDGFVWTEARAPDQLNGFVTEIEADLGRTLDDGYVSEASLAAPKWVADLARSLRHGAMFFFDYGVSRREYYAPDRTDGWLRCHYRHHAHNNPLIYPGIQDLTAWVDFSSLAASAVKSGLEILGYQTQSQFLLGGGLTIEMAGFSELPIADQLALSGQIKTLTLPGEMGENFKCIALGRGAISVPSAFQFADRTQTL